MGFDEAEKHVARSIRRSARTRPAQSVEAEMARPARRCANCSGWRRCFQVGQRSDVDGVCGKILAALEAASSPDASRRCTRGYFLTEEGEPRKSLMTKALKEEHPDLDAQLDRVQRPLCCAGERTCGPRRRSRRAMALYRLAERGHAALQRRQGAPRGARLRRSHRQDRHASARARFRRLGALQTRQRSGAYPGRRIPGHRAGAVAHHRGAGRRILRRGWRARGGAHASSPSATRSSRSTRSRARRREKFARMGRQFTARPAQAAVPRGARCRSIFRFARSSRSSRAVDACVRRSRRARRALRRARGRIEHLARRVGQAGLVEIWPVEAYEAPDDADPWLPLDETDEAFAGHRGLPIASPIRSRVGWPTGESLASENRPIRPGDILILVRKRNPFAGPMVAALKARGIARRRRRPHQACRATSPCRT